MVTQLLADRLASENIHVFEVRPGIIDTDMTKDVAKAVLACCSGNLDYSCGQVIDADGGFACRRL